MWSCTQITSLICFPQGKECKNNIRESPWPGVCTHGRMLWASSSRPWLSSVVRASGLCPLFSAFLLAFSHLCSPLFVLQHPPLSFSFLIFTLSPCKQIPWWCLVCTHTTVTIPHPAQPNSITSAEHVLCGAPRGQHSLWWTVLGTIMSADTHAGLEKTKRRLSSEASRYPELTHHCIWKSGHWLFSSSNSKHLKLSLCSNRGSVIVSQRQTRQIK